MVAALPKGWTSGEPTVHPTTYGDQDTHEVVLIRGWSYIWYAKDCLSFFLRMIRVTALRHTSSFGGFFIYIEDERGSLGIPRLNPLASADEDVTLSQVSRHDGNHRSACHEQHRHARRHCRPGNRVG